MAVAYSYCGAREHWKSGVGRAELRHGARLTRNSTVSAYPARAISGYNRFLSGLFLNFVVEWFQVSRALHVAPLHRKQSEHD
jgi:hypothetical protein